VESIAADLGRALQHALLYDRERTLVDRLLELDRTKTDFLSTVSHELRTPLTSITGYIELLRDEVATFHPSAVRMLDVIERNSYRLNALIEDLLVLSRIESGAVQVQRVPVDVASLVHNACADVEPGAVEAGLTLDVVDGPPATRVTGDPGQLDRVLLNLLSNAVKFTPPGGRVTVGWEVQRQAAAQPEAVVTVVDTGIGIPEAEHAQLASRFFRASNAMDAAIPGTGLGLTIVRGILELHGGSLTLRSTPAGTEVSVRLPLAVTTARAEPPGTASVSVPL
jgi:signal transduction histidine kinase